MDKKLYYIMVPVILILLILEIIIVKNTLYQSAQRTQLSENDKAKIKQVQGCNEDICTIPYPEIDIKKNYTGKIYIYPENFNYEIRDEYGQNAVKSFEITQKDNILYIIPKEDTIQFNRYFFTISRNNKEKVISIKVT